MKKIILLPILLVVLFTNLSAHNLWLETAPTGTSGESQQIHVYYGEYTYDYYEKVDENFRDVENFKLWVIAPDGEKRELTTTAGELEYTAEFTPEKSGVYTILLSSTDTEVVDWREYDLGILKPNFYATASVVVDEQSGTAVESETLSGRNPLVIYDNDPKTYNPDVAADITVLFDGEPVAEQEVIISIANQWTKTVYTDENGTATFTLPWEGQYVIEAIFTEEEPGHFKGKDYEAVRHTTTYTLKAK